jgi:hypothetical protein
MYYLGNAYKIFVQNSGRRDWLGVDGWITLIWILKK